MARPPRIDFEGGTYHVTVRGNERRSIFRDDDDRNRYLARLAVCRERFDFYLYAYCLMTNHVHLLIERGETPLSRIMLNLQSHYSQQFNRRHQRVGHLFQGRYKAFLVDRDRYFACVLRYIHRNPVAAGMIRLGSRYRWSSDRWYRGGTGPPWLDVRRALSFLAPSRIAAQTVYRRVVDGPETGIAYDDLPPVRAVIKGDDDFADLALRRLRELPRPRSGLTPEIVARAVADAQHVRFEAVLKRGNRSELVLTRAIAAYLARQEAGIPIARMAALFRLDESTLVRSSGRIEDAMRTDVALRREIEALAATLRL